MISPLKLFLMPPSSKALTIGTTNLDTNTGTTSNTIQMGTMMISRVMDSRKRNKHLLTSLLPKLENEAILILKNLLIREDGYNLAHLSLNLNYLLFCY